VRELCIATAAVLWEAAADGIMTGCMLAGDGWQLPVGGNSTVSY